MPLNIPKSDIAGIVNIIRLSEESVGALAKALANVEISIDPEEMAKHISSNISSIPLEQLSTIIDTLYSIYHFREFSGFGLSRFLNDLIEGIATSSYPELDNKNIDYDILRARFEKLLNINSIRIVSKAARLQTDGERLYCSSKILSDIRPVFNEDPSIRPIGAVITHTLKIVYHSGKDLEEFHVVLDSYELETLKDVIVRACIKDETLRTLMEETNLKNLGA
jgi:hypothetical protein